MKAPVEQVVDDVIAAMQDRPEDFTIGDLWLTDAASGLRYWIANGFGFYELVEPFNMHFGLLHGWRFGLALKRLKAMKHRMLQPQPKGGKK